MMNALTGSRVNVTGSRTATVIAGPIPGRTPTAVPSVTPANAQRSWVTVSAWLKPSASARSVSCTLEPMSKQSGWEWELQNTCEQEICPDGDHDRDSCIACRMASVEGARRAPEKNYG